MAASPGIPESDWKLFRQLREVALDRFCKRVLDELDPLRRDTTRSHHERFLDVFDFLLRRNKALARAFDDPRRSRMIDQLAAMHAEGLLEPDEVTRFTARTRQAIDALGQEIVR